MIIDAHAHCGGQDTTPPQAFEDYLALAAGTGIGKVTAFPPVMEIYDRYDPDFSDTPQWRQRRQQANDYLLTTGHPDCDVIPYLFIWNDFAVDQITPRHKGIKWHRHPGEPVYHYDDPRCQAAIDDIRQRNMPIVLEEEFGNTLWFINSLAQNATIIIPHLGLLNGGYERLRNAGIWERPNVYADTALAPSELIIDYITRYGYERIMFGSDFPFGNPEDELNKIQRLNISERSRDAMLHLNISRLTADSNP